MIGTAREKAQEVREIIDSLTFNQFLYIYMINVKVILKRMNINFDVDDIIFNRIKTEDTRFNAHYFYDNEEVVNILNEDVIPHIQKCDSEGNYFEFTRLSYKNASDKMSLYGALEISTPTLDDFVKEVNSDNDLFEKTELIPVVLNIMTNMIICHLFSNKDLFSISLGNSVGNTIKEIEDDAERMYFLNTSLMHVSDMYVSAVKTLKNSFNEF